MSEIGENFLDFVARTNKVLQDKPQLGNNPGNPVEFKIGETVIVKHVSTAGRKINQKLAGLVGPITDIQRHRGQTFVWVDLPGHCQSYCWFYPEDLRKVEKHGAVRKLPHPRLEENIDAAVESWEAMQASIRESTAKYGPKVPPPPDREKFKKFAEKWLAAREERALAQAQTLKNEGPSWRDIKVTIDRKQAETPEDLGKPVRREADPHGKDPHEMGAKLDAGKVQAGVLLDFSRALWKVAEVGTHGNGKYARGSWQFVEEAEERYEDAMMRHLLKIRVEPTDESGLETLAHFAWNALAVLELSLREEGEA